MSAGQSRCQPSPKISATRRFQRGVVVAGLSLAALGLTACGDKAGPAGAPPAPEVAVVKVQAGSVPLVAELPGRLESSRVAQVRARVPGVVQRIAFTEGSEVRAGQLLFQIDPAPFQAALQTAQAAQARAEANLAQTTALLERSRPLNEAKAISPQEFLTIEVAQRAAQADLGSAKAAVDTARINLGYAAVSSPINGRIGRALVTEGALVGQGEVTQLALVQQTSPLFVNFSQSAAEAMGLRRALEAGQLKSSGKDAASARIVLDDGSEYPQPARVLFTDLTVDPASGQVSLRAEVPNPQGRLLPGLFVRVRIEQAQVGDGFLVPQQAVTRGTQSDTVMVVDGQGNVSSRPVNLGSTRGNQWIVLSGLQSGEQVVVEGFHRIRPNVPVRPVPWTPAAAGAPKAAPAASAPAQS